MFSVIKKRLARRNVGDELDMAVSRGSTGQVREILESRQKANASYIPSSKALESAVQGLNADVVKLLVDAGADVRGSFALLLAAAAGDKTIVGLLVLERTPINR